MTKQIFKRKSVLIIISVIVSCIYGCVSAPPEIAIAHSKELEIIHELQRTHGALIDAYVDKRIKEFDQFFFTEYGKAYLANWKEAFPQVYNREYEETRDFQILYNDLVAEYIEAIAPIEEIRKKLHWAVAQEYRNVYAIHQSVGNWIYSVENLTTSEKNVLDSVLALIDPSLSFEEVDKALMDATSLLKEKLNQFIENK